MSRGRVMVELGKDGTIQRIFRFTKHAFAVDPQFVKEYSRKDAVAAIRHAVFERSGGYCEACGIEVTEHSGWHKGEMHERVPRGRGGEISLDNSIFVCRKCHEQAHSSRKPLFGVQKSDG